jgi:hypothetical protein
MSDNQMNASDDYLGRIRGVKEFVSDKGSFNSISVSGEQPKPNDDYRIHSCATAKEYFEEFSSDFVEKAILDYDKDFDIMKNIENCPADLTGYPWA